MGSGCGPVRSVCSFPSLGSHPTLEGKIRKMPRVYVAQPPGTVANLKRGSGLYDEPLKDGSLPQETMSTKVLVRVLLTTRNDKWAVIDYAGKVWFVHTAELVNYAQELPLEDALNALTRTLLKKIIEELPALIPETKP